MSAALALSTMLSTRRPPGIPITAVLLASIHARTRRCGEIPRRFDSSANRGLVESLLAPPKGEYGRKAIPCFVQCERTPSVSGSRWPGLHRFWTLTIGTIEEDT